MIDTIPLDVRKVFVILQATFYSLTNSWWIYDYQSRYQRFWPYRSHCFPAAQKRSDIEIVAINDLLDAVTWHTC